MNIAILPCPCRVCTKRNELCHVTCVDYLGWRKEYDKLSKAEKSSECDSREAIDSHFYKCKRRKRYNRRRM